MNNLPSWYQIIVNVHELTHRDLEDGIHVQLAKEIEMKVDKLEEELLRGSGDPERSMMQDEDEP